MSEANETYSPSALMREWHPDLFPDTPPLDETILEQGLLEYHLETLTERKQELIFEEFCRRLAQLEICPNLRPQTGPIGGGDSKVDSSTYPVAPYLAERVYFGSPTPATTESWAFAFSCKKRWKEKAKSDVEKIAGLDREFSRVYFISSHFTRDKTRSELESQLAKQHGFEVHILDRTWIVKVVFEHGRQSVAIHTLGIHQAETSAPKQSPTDVARQTELGSLLDKLSQLDLYDGNDYAIAQDYLEAALLARRLGKPRHEIDGLFVRARTLAQGYGHRGQIIRCGYHHAWTSLWWYEDYGALERIYSELEQYLPGTDDADDCELFSNLWKLLKGSVDQGKISEKNARTEARLVVLRGELKRLAAENQRPNNALHAETLGLFNDIVSSTPDRSKIEHALKGLKKCLRRSRGLQIYPAMQFVRTIQGLGELIGELPGFDALFEEMLRVAEERSGETSKGKLLFERGLQLAEKGEPQRALRLLGEARSRLAKEETMRESIRASLGCSAAYSSIGLFWAARMESIAAAHVSLRKLESFYQYPLEGFLAVKQLAWTELRLGRIGPFAAWHRLCWVLLGHLRPLGFDIEAFEQELNTQEYYLGCWFLNLSPDDARTLDAVLDRLDQSGLSVAKVALMYKLGPIERILDEMPEDLANDRKKLIDFFSQWKSQPVAQQMRTSLDGQTEAMSVLEARMMGVRYRVESRTAFSTVTFAENLLGIIEAAFALANWENLAFIIDEVDILVDVSDRGSNPPAIDLETQTTRPAYEFLWRDDMLEWMRQSQPSNDSLVKTPRHPGARWG